MIDQKRLEKWQELARRDDCFTAADAFVPSDVREMLAEIRRFREHNVVTINSRYE